MRTHTLLCIDSRNHQSSRPRRGRGIRVTLSKSSSTSTRLRPRLLSPEPIVPGARHARLSSLGGGRRFTVHAYRPTRGAIRVYALRLGRSIAPSNLSQISSNVARFARRRAARVLSFLPTATRTCAAPPRRPAPPPAVPDAHRCRCETTSCVRDGSRPNPSSSSRGGGRCAASHARRTRAPPAARRGISGARHG